MPYLQQQKYNLHQYFYNIGSLFVINLHFLLHGTINVLLPSDELKKKYKHGVCMNKGISVAFVCRVVENIRVFDKTNNNSLILNAVEKNHFNNKILLNDKKDFQSGKSLHLVYIVLVYYHLYIRCTPQPNIGE